MPSFENMGRMALDLRPPCGVGYRCTAGPGSRTCCQEQVPHLLVQSHTWPRGHVLWLCNCPVTFCPGFPLAAVSFGPQHIPQCSLCSILPIAPYSTQTDGSCQGRGSRDYWGDWGNMAGPHTGGKQGQTCTETRAAFSAQECLSPSPAPSHHANPFVCPPRASPARAPQPAPTAMAGQHRDLLSPPAQ